MENILAKYNFIVFKSKQSLCQNYICYHTQKGLFGEHKKYNLYNNLIIDVEITAADPSTEKHLSTVLQKLDS